MLEISSKWTGLEVLGGLGEEGGKRSTSLRVSADKMQTKSHQHKRFLLPDKSGMETAGSRRAFM